MIYKYIKTDKNLNKYLELFQLKQYSARDSFYMYVSHAGGSIIPESTAV